MPPKWVIDVSSPDPPYRFCPYEEVTGMAVFGVHVISDVSPGELVGAIHAGGQEACNKWILDHPNWIDEYGPKPKEAHDANDG